MTPWTSFPSLSAQRSGPGSDGNDHTPRTTRPCGAVWSSTWENIADIKQQEDTHSLPQDASQDRAPATPIHTSGTWDHVTLMSRTEITHEVSMRSQSASWGSFSFWNFPPLKRRFWDLRHMNENDWLMNIRINIQVLHLQLHHWQLEKMEEGKKKGQTCHCLLNCWTRGIKTLQDVRILNWELNLFIGERFWATDQKVMSSDPSAACAASLSKTFHPEPFRRLNYRQFKQKHQQNEGKKSNRFPEKII